MVFSDLPALCNLAYGLSKVSLRDYTLGLIGIVPDTILFRRPPARLNGLLPGAMAASPFWRTCRWAICPMAWPSMPTAPSW
jgi:hypothetical protein